MAEGEERGAVEVREVEKRESRDAEACASKYIRALRKRKRECVYGIAMLHDTTAQLIVLSVFVSSSSCFEQL